MSMGQGYIEGGVETWMTQRVEAQQRLEEAEQTYHDADERTVTALEEQDLEAADQMEGINEEVKETLVVDPESNEVVSTEDPGTIQPELDQMEADMLDNDQLVLDEMQSHVEEIQTVLDEIDAIDQDAPDDEVLDQILGGGDEEHTNPPPPPPPETDLGGGGPPPPDDSQRYQEELLLMALEDLDQAGHGDAIDHILDTDDIDVALERAKDIIPILRQDAGSDQGIVTHGLEVDGSIEATPEFKAMVAESMLSGNTKKVATEYAIQQFEAGTDIPAQFSAPEGLTLYKVMPTGSSAPSGGSPYFLTETQLKALKDNPYDIAGQLGLPASSVASEYVVYEMTLKDGQSAELFASTIAPITDSGEFRTGGGEQILVNNRAAFTEPVYAPQHTLVERSNQEP